MSPQVRQQHRASRRRPVRAGRGGFSGPVRLRGQRRLLGRPELRLGRRPQPVGRQRQRQQLHLHLKHGGWLTAWPWCKVVLSCNSSKRLSNCPRSAAPRVVSTCSVAECALVRPCCWRLSSHVVVCACWEPPAQSLMLSPASCVVTDPPSVLQSPNLGGGLYHNNRTGGVDSCIFAGNTVTLDFSGQVWPCPTLSEQMWLHTCVRL